MKIIYLVHDISHADVARRVEALRHGGAEVVVLGFNRRSGHDPRIAAKVIDLGPTQDGNFPQRIASVLKALLQLGRHAEEIQMGDVVMARNLEMLLLGASARRRFLAGKPLVYECLDIHRLMTTSGIAGRLLRSVEGWLLRRSQALVTSSPGFLRKYFEPTYSRLPRPILVENKVFAAGLEDRPIAGGLRPGPPWRIGWFGIIRCRRSLDILAEVARQAPGLIEVVIGGLPATTVFGQADNPFAGIPGVTFVGSFSGEAEAARLYRSVHFTWAMDFYEAGANSDWLLPNRLYRAAYYGAIPIGLATVETGQWMARHEVGLRLDRAEPEELLARLRRMTPAHFAEMRRDLDRIPTSELVTGTEECRALVQALARPDRLASEGTRLLPV